MRIVNCVSPVLVLCASAVAQPVTFRLLDPVPGIVNGNNPNNFSSPRSVGTSSDGTAVVLVGLTTAGDWRTIRWSSTTGYRDIGVPNGARNVFAYAISADGETIVGSAEGFATGLPRRAFRWTVGGGLEILRDVVDGPRPESFASGVSADGLVTTGISLGRTVRWVGDGNPVVLPLPADVQPQYYLPVISADGSTVVGSVSRGRHIRWTGTDRTELGLLPGSIIDPPVGVSANGEVVAGTLDRQSNNYGYRWTSSSGFVPVGNFLGEPSTGVSGIVGDGETIVGSYIPDGDSGQVPLVWTSQRGWRTLDQVLAEYGVASDGTTRGEPPRAASTGHAIVGTTRDTVQGILRVFVATLPAGQSVRPLRFDFGPVSGIGAEHPYGVMVPTRRRAGGPVHINATARMDLGAAVESIDVQMYGASVGTLFGRTGHDCPAAADTDQLIISAETFNAALELGLGAIFTLVPSAAVDAFLCGQSMFSMNVAYSPEVVDCDGDGVDDYEAIALGMVCDVNGNEIPDSCEAVNPCLTDYDRNCVINPDDLADYLGDYFLAEPPMRTDVNGDGATDPDDLADFITAFFAGGC